MAKKQDDFENQELVDALDLDDFEENNDEETIDELDKTGVPVSKDSPEWTKYIMETMLTKNEKVKDRPKAMGLLRIAPFLLESDVVENPLEVHAVSPDYAAVTMTIVFDNGCRFTGSAEVSEKNCSSPFSDYPLATATTRALGRALKTALGLQVLTAEEGNDISIRIEDNDDQDGSLSQVISDTQLNFIDVLCSKNKLNINVREAMCLIMGSEVESVSTLTKNDSLKIQDSLNGWINDSESKPELGEYDSSWRSNFA